MFLFLIDQINDKRFHEKDILDYENIAKGTTDQSVDCFNQITKSKNYATSPKAT